MRWGLPKGLIRKAETPAQAAVREVREETGLTAEVVGVLSAADYWFFWKRGGANVRHHKRVDFFLMRALGGRLSDHDHEVLEARWFGLAAAVAQASFKSEREALAAAAALLRAPAGGVSDGPRGNADPADAADAR